MQEKEGRRDWCLFLFPAPPQFYFKDKTPLPGNQDFLMPALAHVMSKQEPASHSCCHGEHGAKWYVSYLQTKLFHILGEHINAMKRDPFLSLGHFKLTQNGILEN